jgi:hypothetical protein
MGVGPPAHLAASWNFSIAPNKIEIQHSSLLFNGQIHLRSVGQCLKYEKPTNQV